MIKGNQKYHYMLVKLIKQLKIQLPGKTTASVFFAACENKADVALLLEQLWNWWEQGDDFVCNWVERSCGKETKKYTYMFLRQSDFQDLWDGKNVPRRAIDYLKENELITLHCGFFKGVQGRLLRLNFDKIYRACKPAVEGLLRKHQAGSTRKSLLTRARMHTAQPMDLYTYQDILQGTIQNAYEKDPDGFLRVLTDFNRKLLDFNDFRSELALMNPEGDGRRTRCVEPDRIEWTTPVMSTKAQHAGQRLRQTTSIFTRVMEGLSNTKWQADTGANDPIITEIVKGNLDLFVLQFIAVSYILNPEVKQLLDNNNGLRGLKSDLNSPLLLCHKHMTNRQDYNSDPFHPNQLIFNELFTLGWMELRVTFKQAERGKVLLEKLIIDNVNYGATSSLQRLCIFGKIFPDECTLIRKYVAETSRLGERSIPNVYRKLDEQHRKTLRAMYPLAFPMIEKELQC